MTEYSSHMKGFKEILDNESFDLLSSYHDPSTWELLNAEEREMLAYLFTKLGEKELRDTGEIGGSFDLASTIAPSSPGTHYFQAEALLNNSRGIHHLTEACKLLEKASTLSQDAFDIWYIWGVVLTRLGAMEEEPLYFQEALVKFSKAKEFSGAFSSDKLANFYFDWGQAWFFLGKLSGEALDFKNALSMYQEVAKTDLDYAPFWVAYGDAMVELAFLIGKTELFYEAADFYLKSLKLEPFSLTGWLNLGCTYQVIFEFTVDESFYYKAYDCFKQAEDCAADLNPPILWLKWGRLMSSFAKMSNDPLLLEASFEKFARADYLQPDQATILSRWGEAQMILGGSSDNINLLREAEQKIRRGVELEPANHENWYLHGVCLKELGRYFGDASFYERSIEKFQKGISLNQTDPILWHGLALAYFALGDMTGDRSMLEKAIKYCARVVEFGGTHVAQLWNDWGVVLMRLAEITNEQVYIEEALEKFEHIINLQDEAAFREIDLEWLYNYGCALDFHGDFTESEASYEKAIQILNYVVHQDPDYYHARNNLALALSHLGESVSDIDCLQKASDHFEILLCQEPEDEMAWCDWGLTHLHLAQLVHEPIRPEPSYHHYEQAENKFFHAASLGATGAYYHLACLYSLRENFEHAMAYLERAQVAGSLPPLDDILHDEWLEGLRQTSMFKMFISHISDKQEKK